MTSSRPSAVRKNSTVRTPTVPSAWATARARPRASWATIGPTGAGMHRGVEDVPLVAVQGDRIADRPAVDTAGHDDRKLGGEIDPTPRRRTAAGPGWPTRRRFVGAVFDQDLPLAVIARGGRLEDQRQSEVSDGVIELGCRYGPAARGHEECRAGPGSVSRAAGSGRSRASASRDAPAAGAPATAARGPRRSRTRR